MRCSICKKERNGPLSRWDHIKEFLLVRLFAKEAEDIRNDYFTKGISEGYILGFKQANEKYIKQDPLHSIRQAD